MNDNFDAIRRHAHNDLAAIRQHLDKGGRRTTNESRQIHNMMESLTRTLDNMDRIEQRAERQPYSDTNIGYNAAVRRRGRVYPRRRYPRADDMVNDAMDALDRVLPHLTGDYDDDRYDDDNNAEMRQGVPGTGPYGDRRHLGRGGRRRRYTRRAEADAAYNDDRYDDDWDDDDRYDTADTVDARRRRRDRYGRFMDDRRMDDAVTRTAADTAAAVARHMTTRGDVYPYHTPVMPRHDERATGDARMRSDARHDDMRRSDARYDDARRADTDDIGPRT
jgi:hypothetical protein